MKFGGAMFFTDYSMTAMELARALEERGFESVWAPEHSHIPLSRKTPFPGGGELPKQYYDAMDPFVVLAAASQVTKTIKFGTGVLLVQQRDVIQTAKLVASIDQVSQGRFLFGVGGGWNQDEMENHGTVYASRFKRMRESIEAMKEIWTKDHAEYHGEFVNFDPMIARPKPVTKPHPPIHVRSRTAHVAQSVTVTAGFRRHAAISASNFRSSVRWRRRQDAIPIHWRSARLVFPMMLTE
jgi:probable F420-dependent oxidoreductase